MTALVCTPRCPLYARPAPGALTDELLLGWRARVLDTAGGFCRLETDYGYLGWAPKNCLMTDAGAVGRWDALPKRTLLASIRDVLDVPRVQGKTVTTLLRGCTVALDPSAPPEPPWQPVCLPDGRRGWTRSDALGDPPPVPTRDGVRARALEYLGVPYRWGGKSPLGLDCSGLTFMAYRLQGVTIFRDAQLRPPMVPVPLEGALPGDLLYYPGHVALCLGEGRYVHANAQSGGVTVNSLDPHDPAFRPDLSPDKVTAVGRYPGFCAEKNA